MININHLQAAEEQLTNLTASCDRETLIHSLRLLALYVAAYKQEHGELTAAQIETYLQSSEYTPVTLQLFESGLHEAISMLSMVRCGSKPAVLQETTSLLN